MPETFAEQVDLEGLAARVGTPFYLYSGDVLRRRLAAVAALTAPAGVQARYAMKACSTRRILEVIRDAGLWIDAVSGNEVLRAHAAGFAFGVDAAADSAHRGRLPRQRTRGHAARTTCFPTSDRRR